MIRDLPCKLDEGQNSALTCEKCPADGGSNGCVHIQIDLGRTSVLSDRRQYWLIRATGITGRFGDLVSFTDARGGWSRRRISGSTWCARRTASCGRTSRRRAWRISWQRMITPTQSPSILSPKQNVLFECFLIKRVMEDVDI